MENIVFDYINIYNRVVKLTFDYWLDSVIFGDYKVDIFTDIDWHYILVMNVKHEPGFRCLSTAIQEEI